MPSVNILRSSEIKRSPRLHQLEGLFDLPRTDKSEIALTVDLNLPEEWNIGLIVGPSGSGKSTVAKELFADNLLQATSWPADASVLDSFPQKMGIKEIVKLLSSVGFSSPPAWLRPFQVLSNGEQFRVSMARALAEMPGLCVVDEFTSVVDRTVAKIGSAAIAKTVRKRKQKFIAVTCHCDVAEWLEPDWIYQPHLNKLDLPRGSLLRPKIKLEIRRVHANAWKLFKKHHYMSADLNRSAICFCAFWEGEPIAFDAWLPFVGRLRNCQRGHRCHRSVCLPDFQGVGIGSAVNDLCASIWAGLGEKAFMTTSHPAVISAKRHSTNWRLTRYGRGKRDSSMTGMSRTLNRITASFEFTGKSMEKALAERIFIPK